MCWMNLVRCPCWALGFWIFELAENIGRARRLEQRWGRSEKHTGLSSALQMTLVIFLACVTEAYFHWSMWAGGTNLHEIRRSLDEQCWPHRTQGFLADGCSFAAVHVLSWRLAAEIGLGRASLASASRIGASYSSDVFQYLSSVNKYLHSQQICRLIDRLIDRSIYLPV